MSADTIAATAPAAGLMRRDGVVARLARDKVALVAAIEGNKAPALKVGDVVLRIDPRYFRPTEVETLLGDPSKAKAKLGWTPEISVREMCREMVTEDLAQAKKNSLLKANGYEVNVSLE